MTYEVSFPLSKILVTANTLPEACVKAQTYLRKKLEEGGYYKGREEEMNLDLVIRQAEEFPHHTICHENE